MTLKSDFCALRKSTPVLWLPTHTLPNSSCAMLRTLTDDVCTLTVSKSSGCRSVAGLLSTRTPPMSVATHSAPSAICRMSYTLSS